MFILPCRYVLLHVLPFYFVSPEDKYYPLQLLYYFHYPREFCWENYPLCPIVILIPLLCNSDNSYLGEPSRDAKSRLCGMLIKRSPVDACGLLPYFFWLQDDNILAVGALPHDLRSINLRWLNSAACAVVASEEDLERLQVLKAPFLNEF
jgi:hypothetical protein